MRPLRRRSPPGPALAGLVLSDERRRMHSRPGARRDLASSGATAALDRRKPRPRYAASTPQKPAATAVTVDLRQLNVVSALQAFCGDAIDPSPEVPTPHLAIGGLREGPDVGCPNNQRFWHPRERRCPPFRPETWIPTWRQARGRYSTAVETCRVRWPAGVRAGLAGLAFRRAGVTLVTSIDGLLW